MIIHNPILTGSFTVNGTDVSSITSSAASLTSLNAYTASQNNRNGTYATTGSNTFSGIQTVNSNLVVTGSITAQTLVVQTITSSVDFVTGSTRFGSVIGNTHQFTGSVGITGSLNTSGKITANGGGLLLELNGGSDTFLRVTGNRGNGDNLHVGNLEIYNSFSSRLVGEIRGITGAGGTQSNSGQLAFYTNDNGTYSERMRITSGGSVGIGTSIPNTIASLVSTLSLGGTNPTISGGVSYQVNGSVKMYQYIDGDGLFIHQALSGVGQKFNTDNTERMRITSAGNILVNQQSALTGVPTSIEMSGVGSSSPTLQASYNVYANHGSANTTWRGYYVFHKSRGTTAGSVTAVANGDYLGTIRWAGADGTGEVIGAEINAMVDGTVGTNDMPTRLVFSTTADNASDPTERMRITNSGDFNYGNSVVQSSANGTYRQAFWGGMSFLWRNAEDAYINMNHTYSSTNTNVASYTSGNGIGRLNMTGGTLEWIGYNGSVSAGSAYSMASLFGVRKDGLVSFPRINDFTTGNSPNTWINPASSYGIYINTSSIRYKRDVTNYDKGLDIVAQLRPVYYKGISEVDGDKQFAGLIAEEIHDLGLTEFVNYLEDGRPNSLSYPNMITLAFKAIQELKAEIEILKNK